VRRVQVAAVPTRPDHLASVTPHSAGWYAGRDIWASIYGMPLRLADDARRLDTSPDWFAWVGAAHTLDWLAEQDLAAICRHNLALADSFVAGLGNASQGSAIVSIDVPGASDALARAGVASAVRDGRVRASFHLYNNDEDVAAAVAALSDARS
jgi:selenocysteine lyase/cysteine desulfurase